MQNLIWLGNEYFAPELEQCGWERVFIHTPTCYRTFSWRELVDLAGFEPDALVVADLSTPPLLLGVEEMPCLTVFYSVDSHLHSWHEFYAQAFDACLVSLRGHIGRFSGHFMPPERVWWSPAFARSADQPLPGAKKTMPCLFVGTDNADLMPRRHRFLCELADRVPGLERMTGDYRKLFPHANVVVNQAEHGDLNFRVFEAMGCGACLVTPRIGHGLDKLFVDGEHYVGYADGDSGDAAYRISFLLEHPDLASHIGEMALAEVNARHRARHRAEAFTDHMCDLAPGAADLIHARIANAKKIRDSALSLLYLHCAEDMPDEAGARFLAAAQGKFGLNGL